MGNCYVCGANLGIYSKGFALDPQEKYILCQRCYWSVSGYHKKLAKASDLDEIDKLEQSFRKRAAKGKEKRELVEAMEACFEEKRADLKIKSQLLEQYKQSQKKTETMGGSSPKGLKRVSTADTLPGTPIHQAIGPVSAQNTLPAAMVEQPEKFGRAKEELASRLLEEAERAGGIGIIGLTYGLTPLGSEKILVTADGTAVK